MPETLEVKVMVALSPLQMVASETARLAAGKGLTVTEKLFVSVPPFPSLEAI